MRIAVISDIHANILALQAAFADMKTFGVDRILNLGDIVYGPLWPKETYDFLKTERAITIRGNQDREIYEAMGSKQLEENPVLRHTVEDLGIEGIEWLRVLPETVLEGEVLCCHGAPGNDLVYLLENVESGEACLRDDSEIIALLNGCDAPVILCGHSHLARSVRLSTGQLVVNPGSVGLPAYFDDLPVKHRIQMGSPDAAYAILEKNEADWKVGLRRMPYDHAAAARRAREFGRAGKVWAKWLETGRAGRQEIGRGRDD